MIHLIVKDGLGNQMFQYAYARCLQEHYMKEGICEELAINPYFIEHRFFKNNDNRTMSIQHLELNSNVRIQSIQNAYLQPIITQYFASNKSEIWP